jgi:GABA(A) receptor-associated protein
MRFQQEYTFTQRKEQSERILSKYPERIPVICEKSNRSKILELDKKKYLVPGDFTCGQFVYIIRKRLSLPAEKAIFLYIGNCIPPSASCLLDVYNQYKDQDGFLYIQYNEENVFGFRG